ncbi:hypothetical protein, partial [Neisseria sicca]
MLKHQVNRFRTILYCLRLRRLVLIFVNPLYFLSDTQFTGCRHSYAGGNPFLKFRNCFSNQGFSSFIVKQNKKYPTKPAQKTNSRT